MEELSAAHVKNAKLPPGKTEHELHDGGNLVLRLRETKVGVGKAWKFPYRYDGERYKVHIGTYPAITLAAARLKAAEFRQMLAEGKNPAAVLEADEAVAHANRLATEHGEAPATFGELFNRWHRDYLSHHRSDKGEALKSLFERYILSNGVGDIKLSLMRPAHVTAILNRIRDSGHNRTCGVALDAIRQMVVWSVPQEWIQFDPTLGLKKRDWNGQGKERDRALTEPELVQLHWRLKKSYIAKRWKHAIWFILSTGTRIEETMLTERRHINHAASTWSIPPEHQKVVNSDETPKTHVVHLSAFAKKHLAELLAMPGTSKYVLPARIRKGDAVGDRPADEKTLTKAVKNLQTGMQAGRRNSEELLLSGGPWVPHDLRRTMSTLMQELGIHPDVIDKCQNHVLDDKVRRTYQRAALERMKAAAWEQLGEKLESLTQLPDPEPDYAAPRPLAVFLDVTDNDAVAAHHANLDLNAIKTSRKTAKAQR